MVVLRVRKKFWLLAIIASSCLIILNLISSPHHQTSLLNEDNSVLLGENIDYDGVLAGSLLRKDPGQETVDVQIVGLGDLPTIKPLGCVRTKLIHGGSIYYYGVLDLV